MVPRLAALLALALAFATLPSAQAEHLLDPEPHECGPFVPPVPVGAGSGCTAWVCHPDGPSGDCGGQGCPGHWDCEQVVCDYYVETPFAWACLHDGAAAQVRCLTERLDPACLDG